jgi:predicted AAA+ superfamily ATPase
VPDLLGAVKRSVDAGQVHPHRAPRMYHLREEQGRREVDLLIEIASGQLIGIEIKAAATVTPHDARHLAWLRDETGAAFAGGIVLHAGPYAFPIGERISAAPVSALWTP